MITGVGTDIVSVARIRQAIARHGERFAAHILAQGEQADYGRAPDKARFLAKRFAAKEAFSKALGTGLRAPVTLHAIAVTHDELGKPSFQLDKDLSEFMYECDMTSFLSISDEKEYVVAFVVVEKKS